MKGVTIMINILINITINNKTLYHIKNYKNHLLLFLTIMIIHPSSAFAYTCSFERPDVDRSDPRFTHTFEVKKPEDCTEEAKSKELANLIEEDYGKEGEKARALYQHKVSQQLAKDNLKNQELQQSAGAQFKKTSKSKQNIAMVTAAGSAAAFTAYGATCLSTCQPKLAVLGAALGSASALVGALSQNDEANRRAWSALKPRETPYDGTAQIDTSKPRDRPTFEEGESPLNFGNGTTPIPGPTIPVRKLPPETHKALDTHKIKYDQKKGKITLPNGDEFYIKDLDDMIKKASPDVRAKYNEIMAPVNKAIAEASLDTDTKEAMIDKAKKTTAKGKKSSSGFTGYNKGRSSGGGGSALKALRGLSKNARLLASNKKSAFHGMTVKKGNSHLGVSQANIFQMMHERYQTERKSGAFIKRR